jgi:hypothetical protein
MVLLLKPRLRKTFVDTKIRMITIDFCFRANHVVAIPFNAMVSSVIQQNGFDAQDEHMLVSEIDARKLF